MKYPATIMMIYHIKSLEHMSSYKLSLVIPEIADIEFCTQKQSYRCEHSECWKHITSVKIKETEAFIVFYFWIYVTIICYGL